MIPDNNLSGYTKKELWDELATRPGITVATCLRPYPIIDDSTRLERMETIITWFGLEFGEEFTLDDSDNQEPLHFTTYGLANRDKISRSIEFYALICGHQTLTKI